MSPLLTFSVPGLNVGNISRSTEAVHQQVSRKNDHLKANFSGLQKKDQDFLDLLPFMSPLVDAIDNNSSWNLDLILKQGKIQGKSRKNEECIN